MARKDGKLNTYQVMNKYISQLIIMKKRYMMQNAPKAAIVKIQKRIDEFVAVRDGVRPIEYLERKLRCDTGSE